MRSTRASATSTPVRVPSSGMPSRRGWRGSARGSSRGGGRLRRRRRRGRARRGSAGGSRRGRPPTRSVRVLAARRVRAGRRSGRRRRGRRGRGGGPGATTGRRPGVRRAAADRVRPTSRGEGSGEVVVDGEAGAFEAGEPLAQGGDPGVGADGLGECLVPAALRERVARPGLCGRPVERGLVVAGGADRRGPVGRRSVSGTSWTARQTASSARRSAVSGRRGRAGPRPARWRRSRGPGVGEVGDGGGVVEDLLVPGGQVGAPVEVVGEPCGDAGQPGQRPSRLGSAPGGRCRAGVVELVVDAGVEDGGGVVARRRASPAWTASREQGERVVVVEGEEGEVGAQGGPGGRRR